MLMDAILKQEIIDLIKSMQQQDSIEIGNSKTGVIKVYVNFEEGFLAKAKIQTAISILKENRKEVLSE
jgi:hypothetical protein